MFRTGLNFVVAPRGECKNVTAGHIRSCVRCHEKFVAGVEYFGRKAKKVPQNIKTSEERVRYFRMKKAKRMAISQVKRASTTDILRLLKEINYPHIAPIHTNAANLMVAELLVRDVCDSFEQLTIELDKIQ